MEMNTTMLTNTSIGRASRATGESKLRLPAAGEQAASFERMGWGALAMLALGLVLATGCATKGDFRKLEERVLDASRQKDGQPDPFERIAALSAEVESLKEEQRRLAGQLEVAQKTADDALEESLKAREMLAAQSAAGGAVAAAVVGGTAGAAAGVEEAAPELGLDQLDSKSAEVGAYQEALTAWRGDDTQACIDLFRKFLQTYPQSPYADDAAYWMADCHFKQGDYRVAVLRFNDVVRVYPTGNKAPDALYRQGESLLKLGPGFYDAARTVFKQVLKDYPDSDRAKEAHQQLEAIGSG
jgi:tol-pal system protein YbgF